MLRLLCTIVGARRDAFSIRIKARRCVDELKSAIKKACKSPITCDRLDLKFVLATKDGEWLAWDDPLVRRLEDGTARDELEERIQVTRIHPSWSIQRWLAENGMIGANAPKPAEQLHVLVLVPDEVAPPPKLSSFAMQLKKYKVKGELPTEGEFLELFEWTDNNCGKVVDITAVNEIVGFTGSKFYVRMEALRVLENFKSIYQTEFDTDQVVDQQFVLIGSPGTGKSTLLTLICFYIAIHHKRPVVWYRLTLTKQYSTTRLFYEGKHYMWNDRYGEIYTALRYAMEDKDFGLRNPWFVLDDLCEDDLRSRSWRFDFRMLAASGLCDVKSGGSMSHKVCLLPYWRHADLEDLARKLKVLEESDIENRYFASGGNLSDFLDVDAEAEVAKLVDSACAAISKDEATWLLTRFSGDLDKPIDLLRTKGVEDMNNATHYMLTRHWTSLVSSRFVLRKLASIVGPEEYENLMRVARDTHDDRLEDAAFEGYLHALVHQGRPLCIHYCKYDNVDRTTVADWESIMQQKTGSIDWKKPSVVKCKGKNEAECVALMKKWAKKLPRWTTGSLQPICVKPSTQLPGARFPTIKYGIVFCK